MVSDLPADLVEEILARVPATSLKRLRSTCKQWNALFKDQRFTEKHFRKAAKESLILMSKEYRVCSMSINLNVAPPSIEFKGELGLKVSYSNSEQVDIAQVFHCDGLLLCTTKDNRLVVWNPCLGETRWIQRIPGYETFSTFALGYENNNSCRSYKILRCWGSYDYKLRHHVRRFEIYDFSSDTWRVLDDVDNSLMILSYVGVSLKGNTYLLAYDEKEDYKFLFSFDFTAERFKRMCLLPFDTHGYPTLSVFREEKLLLLCGSKRTSKMEMWVTNKIDVEAPLLWSKSFTLDLSIDRRGNSFEAFSSLLIDEEKKVALCCHFSYNSISSKNKVYTIGEDDEYYTEIPYVSSTNNQWWLHKTSKEPRDRVWRPIIFNYVPSLLQI